MSTPNHDHEHRGTFAEGQAVEAHHPEEAPRGDYARGQDLGGHAQEGTFAGGQAHGDRHPERDGHGRFAEGSQS